MKFTLTFRADDVYTEIAPIASAHHMSIMTPEEKAAWQLLPHRTKVDSMKYLIDELSFTLATFMENSSVTIEFDTEKVTAEAVVLS